MQSLSDALGIESEESSGVIPSSEEFTSENENYIPKIDIKHLECEDENIEILSSHNQYSLVMYLDGGCDAKYYDRFIKATERLIRGNGDYKKWLEDIRITKNLGKDAFFPNLDSSHVEIQLHHYPFNLYSICNIVAQSMLNDGLKVSTFILADEVIKLHFDDLVGLVPLTVTTHELAHLDALPIQRNQIKGEWEKFAIRFKDYLSDYDKALLRTLLKRTSLQLDTSPALTRLSEPTSLAEE